MESLEELALLNCLPPGVLEKYFLKIVDKLDNRFLTSNYEQIIELIESKVDIYTMIVVNRELQQTAIIRNLRVSDIVKMFLFTLNNWLEDDNKLTYDTLQVMLQYVGEKLEIDYCKKLVVSDPTVNDIINKFKNKLRNETDIEQLLCEDFIFKSRYDEVMIRVIKSQEDFDYFLEYDDYDRTTIETYTGKESIGFALGQDYESDTDESDTDEPDADADDTNPTPNQTT